ncbi:MAG: lytic transglycosylase domain-containing protein [Herbaspirillum sp.]
MTQRMTYATVRMVLSITLGTLIALSVSASAYADVYGYVDAQGMSHFSTTKLNQRYRLFLRGGDKPFNSSDLMTPGALTKNPLTGAHSMAASPLLKKLSQHPNLNKYETLLNQTAAEFDLEPALLKAVMAAESGFNASAVSNKGAVGLMQLLPATAERYGLQADHKKSIAQKLTDPKTNLRLAARYLRDLGHLFPNRQDLVLASYNAGEGAVQKYANSIPPYPETRNYVKVVSQFYAYFLPAAGSVPLHIGGGRNRIHMTLPAQQPVLQTSQSTPSTLPNSDD